MPKIDFKKELKTFYKAGRRFDGQVQKHHDIYLSDFRRVAPEKLRTVLRQPFIR